MRTALKTTTKQQNSQWATSQSPRACSTEEVPGQGEAYQGYSCLSARPGQVFLRGGQGSWRGRRGEEVREDRGGGR